MFLDISGYHLTYDQEFSPGAPFTISPDGVGVMFKTQLDWGGLFIPSNHEAEFYSDPAYGVNPFNVHDGEVDITAAPAAGGPSPQTWGQPDTSGMLSTQNSFSQHGGYFEIRAELAGEPGLWGGFWMLPTTLQDYPEMDIVEDPNLGNNGEYFLHATAPSGGGGGFVHTRRVLHRGFHQYGVEWNDQTVTFYFDHAAIAEYSTPAAFASLNMYLLVNLAVGGPGSWPGPAPASSLPAVYKIDYIRAFSNNPADPEVPQQPISSPDKIDTTPVYSSPVLQTVTTGTGPNVVTLGVAEDFFQSDAHFIVTIDGVQQGGIFASLAANNHGQTQNFVFNGTFAPGAHNLGIRLLDHYDGGSPGLARNLYVTSATVDGQPIAGAVQENTGVLQTTSFVVP